MQVNCPGLAPIMCDERSRKRQLERDSPPVDRQRSLSRDEIEQFYAGLARTELNQDPSQTRLQWWSEVAPGELRFRCSFKRPSIEAVDEVVKRLSGDSIPDLSFDGQLESTVQRISIDMEDGFGRQPSMEELAAGIAIVSNSGLGLGQLWCEERLEQIVRNDFKTVRSDQWEPSSQRPCNRTVIPASMTDSSMMMDEDEPTPRRRSLGKASDETADLEWLRQSSTAAIEALKSSQGWRAHDRSQGWQLNTFPAPVPSRTTIRAHSESDDL